LGLKDIVEEYAGRLTDADRRLLAVLLVDPVESSFLPAQTVAKRAGVHQSTAGRLAQKLGFDSYRTMKAHLRSDVISEVDSAAGRIRGRLDRMAQGSILDALVESEVRTLMALPKQIDGTTMTAAAEALRDARRIFLFGQGHASSLTNLFARRLNRSGYDAIELQHLDWQASDVLLSMRREDLVVACAFRRPAERLDRLLGYTRDVGARCMLISDLSGLSVRPKPDILLAASRGEDLESQSLTVPMAICNALILELSRCDDGRSIEALERLSTLARHFAASGEPAATRPADPRKKTDDEH
jgi:DNA-binding MurR/RpiR family transcriptional regulator